MSSAPSPSPSPLPTPPLKPVRKLSNAAASAISAGHAASRMLPTLHALSSQVGGHPGVMASEDNSLIVKTSLHNERTFYELVAQGREEVREVGRWTPKFYGVLKLEGKVVDPGADAEGGDGMSNATATAEAALEHSIEPIPESIVLENVSSAFTKPNIMDIKLGTVLYEEDATEEKKERMLETARKTTSLETGVRLTGFQVYDHTTHSPSITTKAYGKSIQASDLPDGMRRFFPLSSSSSPSPEGQGLPHELILPIIKGLLNDIRQIRDALAKTELRMVGGSLLIVYEADWDVAREALEARSETRGGTRDETATNSAGLEHANDEDEMGYDSDEESDEEGQIQAYAVRLIDFAHTRLTPGEGADLGVLKGVDTTISLIEGRIKELEVHVK